MVAPRSAAETRVIELEQQVQALTAERDDLRRDVEALCLQGGGSMFSSSYVLTERIQGLENDVRSMRAKLQQANTDKALLDEDLMQLRTDRLRIDKALQDTTEELKKERNQREWWEAQSMQAVKARDELAGELEAQKAAVLRMELDMQKAAGSADVLGAKVAELESKLKDAQATIHRLETELQSARQLSSNNSKEAIGLQEVNAKLKAQLLELQAQADHRQKLLQQAHKIEDQLTTQVADLQAALVDAKRQAEASPDSRTHPGDHHHPQRQFPSGQISEASPELNGHVTLSEPEWDETRRRLEAEAQQARQALEYERQAHADEREQVELLGQMVKDLKVKLAQATQEKVEALMRAASLTHSVGEARAQAAQAVQAAATAGQQQQQQAITPTARKREGSRSLFAASSPHRSGGFLSSLVGATAAAGQGALSHSRAASMSSEDAQEVADNAHQHHATAGAGAGAAGGSAVSAAASAAASQASLEAAEGRCRQLQASMDRLQAQLSGIDKLSVQCTRHLNELRTTAGVLWSPSEARHIWSALSGLARIAEEAAALRASHGLPPSTDLRSPATATGTAGTTGGALPLLAPAASAPARASSSTHGDDSLSPSSPAESLGSSLAVGSGPSAAAGTTLASTLSATRPPLAGGTYGHGGHHHNMRAPGAGTGGGEGLATGAVVPVEGAERRVALALLGLMELGVTALEQYNAASARAGLMLG